MQNLKQWVKANFPGIVYGSRMGTRGRLLVENHTRSLMLNPPASISDAALDVFTTEGEDGIIQYVLSKMQQVPKFFVDIGSGDCIKSNCAFLALHSGWDGIFLDQDNRQLNVGRKFYNQKIQKGQTLRMIPGKITPGNINKILMQEQAPTETGLLSIDIDGNDYWVWKAITVIRPHIVVIEAKVEFGNRNLVVPAGDHNHHSIDPRFNGASVEALRLLGKEKGYKLIGANKPGYNLFFVQEECALQEVATSDVLGDPETKASFYPDSFFTSHTFAD